MAVVQVGVPAAGGRLVTITGGSMAPGIPVGSLVIEAPVQQDRLQVGEVVTLRTGSGHLVTHRIVRLAAIGSTAYVETRGDANATPDPVVTPAANVVGRMVLAIPDLGAVALAIGRPAGWLALVSVLIILWLGAELLRRSARADSGPALIRAPARSGGEP
jgi:signal peptidase I